MKQKRNIFITGLAVTLAAATLLGGATLAYLRSETEDVVNTFNANQVSVALTETDGNGNVVNGNTYEIIPGTTGVKDPKVTLNNTVDAYAFVKITDTTDGLVTYDLAQGWTALDGYQDVYYREVEGAAQVKTFSVLQNDQVTYDAALENDAMTDADGNLKTGMALTFKALAIQKAEFETAVKAYEALLGNWIDNNDSEWNDTTAQTLEISTAAQLANFAKRVNDGESFTGKTIMLTDNIDLAGHLWTPIGTGRNSFHGTFEGNHKTISNLTVQGQGQENVGLFGVIIGATIQNVTVDQAEIIGGHWAGGICGYSYGSFVNCTVTNSKITAVPYLVGEEFDNGDKVGGIVGYQCALNHNVTNCTVQGTTVTGYRDVGGLIGCAITSDGGSPIVSGNRVQDVTVVQDNTNAYKSDTITTYAALIGRDATATKSDNVTENVTLLTR